MKHWYHPEHEKKPRQLLQENKATESHWSWDKTAQGGTVRRSRPPIGRCDETSQWKHNQFEPRDTMPQGSIATGEKGSREAKASFRTKTVFRPVPVLRQDGTPIRDKKGQPLIRFIPMGLQNIVSVTVYGNTVVFKKMQKAETIRDSRNKKSHRPETIRLELCRLLGLFRGLKGYEMLMKKSES